MQKVQVASSLMKAAAELKAYPRILKHNAGTDVRICYFHGKSAENWDVHYCSNQLLMNFTCQVKLFMRRNYISRGNKEAWKFD